MADAELALVSSDAAAAQDVGLPDATGQVADPWALAMGAASADVAAAFGPGDLVVPLKTQLGKTYEPIDGVRPQFGEGREDIAGGGFYEGPFRYGLRDGFGVLVSNAAGTERYDGQFKAEHCDGKGRKVWPDQARYDGQWQKGRKHGQGALQEAGARRYEGGWKDGKRDGVGFQIFDAQTRYDGRWENGLQHGSGKYLDEKTQTTFEGQWVCGSRHGPGILRGKEGYREKLVYCHGMLTSSEVIQKPGVYGNPSVYDKPRKPVQEKVLPPKNGGDAIPAAAISAAAVPASELAAVAA